MSHDPIYYQRTPAQSKQAVLNQQNSVFDDALAKGTISRQEYDEAMKEQNRQATDPNARAVQNQQTQEYLASKAYYEKIGYSQFGGLYSVPDVPANMAVTKVEESGGSLKFTLEQVESPALKQAKAFTDMREQSALRANAQQGTRTASVYDPRKNLSPEDRQQYDAWLTERNRGRVANLGTFIIAGALVPVVGPAVAVKGAMIGVGVSQAVKTGTTAYLGGNVAESLLTPTEAVQAAEFGVIFAGADYMANAAILRYGGQVGAKLVGSTPTIGVAEKVAYGAGRFGLDTAKGTVIMTGIDAAVTGQVTSDDFVRNVAFSAGFAATYGVGRFAASKMPKIDFQTFKARITPQRVREAALYDRVVLSQDTSAPIGGQSWVKQLNVKTSTSPTERAIYNRVVLKPSEGTASPSPMGTDLHSRFMGKTDIGKIYENTVLKANQPAKHKPKGDGTGRFRSGGDIEVTRISPRGYASQSLIVRQKPKEKMKPFWVLSSDVKTIDVSSLPIRDFTRQGVGRLKPKVKETSKPLIVVDPVGVKAISDKAKAALKEQPSQGGVEWVGLSVANPFTKYRGRSFYALKSHGNDEIILPATSPPSEAGSTSHLSISRLDYGLRINPFEGLGLGEIQRSRNRDVQRFDQINAQTVGFFLGQAQGEALIQTQTTGEIQKTVYGQRQTYDVFQQGRGKAKSIFNFSLSGFDLFGLGSRRSGGKGGYTHSERVYPILTGAAVLERFLSKSKQSPKRRKKK